MEIHIPLKYGLALRFNDSIDLQNDYPTALLQKGLVLSDKEQELAEEAVGFGVPVIKRGLHTIFPGSVTLSWLQRGQTHEITAGYRLNLVEKTTNKRKKIIKGWLFYNVKDIMASVIRRVRPARRILASTSTLLRRLFGLETTYVNTSDSMDIVVSYTIDAGSGEIDIQVDAGKLKLGITEVIVMNELGAHHFNRYHDSSGLILEGEQVGCWEPVSASQAWFESSSHKVTFKLQLVHGATLYRGREMVPNRLAWSGFGYSFPPSLTTLQYRLVIGRIL